MVQRLGLVSPSTRDAMDWARDAAEEAQRPRATAMLTQQKQFLSSGSETRYLVLNRAHLLLSIPRRAVEIGPVAQDEVKSSRIQVCFSTCPQGDGYLLS